MPNNTKQSGWKEYKGKHSRGGGGLHGDHKAHPKEESKTAHSVKENYPLTTHKIMTLSNLGVQIFTLDCSPESEVESMLLEEGYPSFQGAELAKFSPSGGNKVAVGDPQGIHIIDLNTK